MFVGRILSIAAISLGAPYWILAGGSTVLVLLTVMNIVTGTSVRNMNTYLQDKCLTGYWSSPPSAESIVPLHPVLAP